MEDLTKRSKKTGILIFFLRLILAGLLLSAILYFAGPYYIRLFLPLFPFEIERLHPEYDISRFYLNDKNQVMYQVTIHKESVDKKGDIWAQRELTGGIVGRTMYISPIFIFSLLLAWPGLSIKERLKAFLVALPLLIVAQLIDIPIHLINRMEEPWPVDSPGGQIRQFWVYLLNNGGRQFLAFLVVFISIAAVRIGFRFRSHSTIMSEVGRNDPCPCGSGKKYKRCCGK